MILITQHLAIPCRFTAFSGSSISQEDQKQYETWYYCHVAILKKILSSFDSLKYVILLWARTLAEGTAGIRYWFVICSWNSK